MLLPDDQLLIERDRVLPGLPLVFDGDAFAAALQAHLPDVRIDAARLLYVRYKPRTSCLASFQLDTSAGRVDAHAVAYPAGEHEKLHKGVTEAQPGALGPGALVLRDASVAVHVFPNDLRLEALRELSDGSSRSALLRKLLPAHPDLWDASITRLAYKPHRRFVAKLASPADGTPRAVVKFYTRGGYESATRNAKAIESRNRLRVPRRMGRSNRNAIAVYRWIDGMPLGPVDQMKPELLERFGAAVRDIHAQPAPQLPLIDRAAEARRLVAIASALSEVLPQLAHRARRAVQQLLESFVEPRIITTIHGDLHAKQVLMIRRRCAVLDLDEAARSSPLADLGNFIAHLHRSAIQIGAPEEQVIAAGEAMLAGYGFERTTHARQELAWHTAASLLRLTPHPFRVRETDWASRTEAMLARVEQILVDAGAAASTPPSPSSSADATPLDPFGVCDDESLGSLARDALDVARIWPLTPAAPVARALRVARYKPRRRCIIEYELSDGSIAIGKIRAKGADRAAFRLLQELRQRGFGDDAPDGVIVPEPLALVETCNMWVQRKVCGTPADRLLPTARGPALGRRVAEALVKLHRAGVPARKRHTIEDELLILRTQLDEVAQHHPQWQARILSILDACTSLAHTLPPPPHECGIHRDFYADHVIVTDADRLCLIDLDLYCGGDPSLDAGNFLAHVTEQALRELQDPEAMTDVERALEDRFIELVCQPARHAVRVYRALSLARHIAISRRLAARRHLTSDLIGLCERELSRLSKSTVLPQPDNILNPMAL